MVFEYGNMWDVFNDTDNFLITTNSFVKGNGCLVMGRGIAYEASQKFPSLPKDAGGVILEHGPNYHVLPLGNYELNGAIGFKSKNKSDSTQLWLFQVKRHWKEDASLKLIEIAASQLRELANLYPYEWFDLNFPGIGFGRLKEEDVLPIIEPLPDNVRVWRK